MRAMILDSSKCRLRETELPDPEVGPGKILLRVRACGVCRTDLHVVDGELGNPKLPIIPGHQIVGLVQKVGEGVVTFSPGERLGVTWLGRSCGECGYCRSERENLCDSALYTGYQIDGGFAEFCVADAQFCVRIPEGYEDLQAAPLLCAGLIGYRALRMAGEGEHLGFYGFGASAHILIQVARYQKRKVYVFTRPGDLESQRFARELGAAWVGGSNEEPAERLHAAIVFAPVGELVPLALRSIRKGGVVVCAGIHMSDIPSFPYSILWGERSIQSVANLTRRDANEFLSLAPKVPVKTEVVPYPLERVNDALDNLRAGKLKGAAVIEVSKLK